MCTTAIIRSQMMADCRWAGAEVVWRAWRHLQQQLLQVAHVAVAVHVQAGALPYR